MLWSYRTTSRKAIGGNPFTLYFGVNAVIPAKIGNESLQCMAFDEQENDQMMCEHLTLIDEVREQASKRDEHYKKQVARYHNAKSNLQQLKEGDLVCRKMKLVELIQTES